MAAMLLFPTKRRVLHRLGLDYPDRRAAIDAELRRVEQSIATLQKVKAALLVEYKRELRRTIEICCVFLWLAIAVAAIVLPVSVFGNGYQGIDQACCRIALDGRELFDPLGERPYMVLIEGRSEEVAWLYP